MTLEPQDAPISFADVELEQSDATLIEFASGPSVVITDQGIALEDMDMIVGWGAIRMLVAMSFERIKAEARAAQAN